MKWKNKVLELVIEGNKESNALGKQAGRFLAMKRDLDITSGAAAELRDKRLQLAAEIVARRGHRAARKNTKEEVFYQKRLKKLIEDKPASFQGPKHYDKEKQAKWNTIMHAPKTVNGKPVIVNGEPVWNTAEEATKIVDNDTKKSNSSTKTTS